MVPDTELLEAVKSSKGCDSDSEAAGNDTETNAREDATAEATSPVGITDKVLKGDAPDNVTPETGTETDPGGSDQMEDGSASVAECHRGHNLGNFSTDIETLKLEEVDKQPVAAAEPEAEDDEGYEIENLIDNKGKSSHRPDSIWWIRGVHLVYWHWI